MVASVNILKDDSLLILEKVIKERRTYQPYQAFFDSIKPALIEQFSKYIKHSGDPRIISPLDLLDFTDNEACAEARKITLIGLYTPQDHQTPYQILARMRHDNDLLFCPCCGEDGAPGTLDHYLPKDVFPELAICLANLTPMCDRCQREKSTKYISDSGYKTFIHPYFDIIDECFFHLDIKPPFNSPSNFELSIVRCGPLLVRVLLSHIIGIKFPERLVRYCEKKHMHLLKLIAKERKDGNPEPAKKIIKFFLMQEEEKAPNAWGAIYYRSVLESPKLLEHLDNGKLPNWI
jgi:hypothetical protein